MKKLLDSDWLRAVQFKHNTSAKSVTPECKLHIVILDYDFLKDNGKFAKPVISSKTMIKILYGNFKKSFLKYEKMASRKIFLHFLHMNFSMPMLLGGAMIKKSFPFFLPILKVYSLNIQLAKF